MSKFPKSKVPLSQPEVLPPPSKTPLLFYRTKAGTEPVRDWLKQMGSPRKLEIGLDLMRAQFRWPVGMPLVRPMGQGLFEVRTSLADGTIARVFVCLWGGALYALHGIIKKTEATPNAALKIARERQKDVENGRQ